MSAGITWSKTLPSCWAGRLARPWVNPVEFGGWGHAIVPLDETLVMVAVDWSGRPYATVDTTLDGTMVETLSGDLVAHFLESFAVEARINLYAKVLAGVSPHHKAEALCKALARALRDAVEPDPRAGGQVPSTKGTLDS